MAKGYLSKATLGTLVLYGSKVRNHHTTQGASSEHRNQHPAHRRALPAGLSRGRPHVCPYGRTEGCSISRPFKDTGAVYRVRIDLYLADGSAVYQSTTYGPYNSRSTARTQATVLLKAARQWHPKSAPSAVIEAHATPAWTTTP